MQLDFPRRIVTERYYISDSTACVLESYFKIARIFDEDIHFCFLYLVFESV